MPAFRRAFEILCKLAVDLGAFLAGTPAVLGADEHAVGRRPFRL